jgi:magnesium-protoporphyrin IX monomethyl ester (oxidative) cyclase
VILNTNHPEFFRRLEECSDINLKLTEINNSNNPKIVKFFRKLPLILSIIGHLLRLYFIKPIDAELSRQAVW